jgi:hypothetical protein
MAHKMFADEALMHPEAGKERPAMPNPTLVSAPTAYMFGREALRNRGWTQSQINAPTPDPVIPPDKTNHLAAPVPRRLWKRERIIQLEQQPEWKERRARMDATALTAYGRDMPAVRAARRRDNKKWPQQ